jgi:predicted Na+-dependent transporter
MLAGFIVPGDYEFLRPSIPILLGGILFFSCLKVPFQDIVHAARQSGVWWRLSWLTTIKLLALPLLAWAVVRLIAPQWAAGVLLMGMMPAAFTSMALTDLYHGNRLTALLLMMLGSLAVPITMPLLIAWCTDGHISVMQAASEAGYVALLLFCPFIAAQFVRWLVPQWTTRHYQQWGPARGCAVGRGWSGACPENCGSHGHLDPGASVLGSPLRRDRWR